MNRRDFKRGTKVMAIRKTARASMSYESFLDFVGRRDAIGIVTGRTNIDGDVIVSFKTGGMHYFQPDDLVRVDSLSDNQLWFQKKKKGD
jgi:hypothetical protein